MPLSEQDAQFYTQLANDPIARPALMKHLKRINPDLSLPEIDAQERLETQVQERLKPLQDEITELKTQVGKKLTDDLRDRLQSSVRQHPWNLNDEQVKELEARMHKSPVMFPDYVEALKYFRYEDAPNHPQGIPSLSPFGHKSAQTESWRELVSDPKSPVWTDRKNYMREEWAKGSDELSRGTSRR